MKKIKDSFGLILFYAVLIFGVVALNLRFRYLNQQKSTDSINSQQVSTAKLSR